MRRLTISICCRISVYSQIVRQFNNTYATSYLLEKAGDIHGAFQLLLEVRVIWQSETQVPKLKPKTMLLQNIEKQTTSTERTTKQLSFDWSHFRISSTDSKGRTTLYSKINSITGKYCSVAFF